MDPGLVDAAEAALTCQPGVLAVRTVRMRWIGHRLHAEAELSIDATTSLDAAHQLAHDAEATLIRAVPKLTSALVHAYPAHPNETHLSEPRPSAHILSPRPEPILRPRPEPTH